MVSSSSYPIVHYPAELLKVLQLAPKRETYRDKPPERSTFQSPLNTKYKLLCLFLRLVGKSAEAARLTLTAHQTGRQAYDAAMTTHLASWKAFEEVQDARLTEAALLFVGDPRQAIMGFRGADNDSIETIRQLPGDALAEPDYSFCWCSPDCSVRAVAGRPCLALQQRHRCKLRRLC